MSAEHARFADWDAAYLLGALGPADRRAFEEHLDSCTRCARAIAELAPTLGLLARVDPVRAASLQDDPPTEARAPDGAAGRAALLARAAHQRRRRRARWVGALAAAAALVVAVAVGMGTLLAPAPEDSRAVALATVVDAPLSATVELVSVGWGTRLDLECTYDGGGGPGASAGVPYTLVVRDREGNPSEVSSWRAAPGATARLSGATALDRDQIATVEIWLTGTDEVLMRADLAEG
jgi:hypothetical protein